MKAQKGEKGYISTNFNSVDRRNFFYLYQAKAALTPRNNFHTHSTGALPVPGFDRQTVQSVAQWLY
jgi:hypothetical protein